MNLDQDGYWKNAQNGTPKGASELKAMLCETVAVGPACVVVKCYHCGWESEKMIGEEAILALSEHLVTHNRHS